MLETVLKASSEIRGDRKPFRFLKWVNAKTVLCFFLLNLILAGGLKGFQYARGYPFPLWYIQKISAESIETGNVARGARIYPNSVQVLPHQQGHIGSPVNLALKQAWKTQLPKGVFGAVTLSGDSLFVGCDDGNTYELDQGTGQILRRFYTGTEVTPAPVIWNSRIFIGEGMHTSHHSRIYSFDLQTGQFIGAFETLGHTEASPYIASFNGITSMFVVAGMDGVYSVDPMTLQQRWHRKIGHVDAEVRVAGQTVFVGTGTEKGTEDHSHQAFGLDFISGENQWHSELEESSWMPPVFIGNEVCYGTGEIYRVSHFGQLACFDKTSGLPTHTITTESPLLGIPLQVGNTLVTSDLDGQICAYQWPEAQKLWCRKTEAKRTYASVVSDGPGNLVYPTSQDGILVLDEHTGKTLKTWRPRGSEGPWKKTFSRVVINPRGWFVADSIGQVRRISLN